MPILKYILDTRYKIYLSTKNTYFEILVCQILPSTKSPVGVVIITVPTGTTGRFPVNPSFLLHHRVQGTPLIMLDAVAI